MCGIPSYCNPQIENLFLKEGSCLDVNNEKSEKMGKFLAYTLLAIGYIAYFVGVLSLFAASGLFPPSDFLSALEPVTLGGGITLTVIGIFMMSLTDCRQRAFQLKYAQAEVALESQKSTLDPVNFGAQKTLLRLLQGKSLKESDLST
jgi:hypothetical protein